MVAGEVDALELGVAAGARVHVGGGVKEGGGAAGEGVGRDVDLGQGAVKLELAKGYLKVTYSPIVVPNPLSFRWTDRSLARFY